LEALDFSVEFFDVAEGDFGFGGLLFLDAGFELRV